MIHEPFLVVILYLLMRELLFCKSYLVIFVLFTKSTKERFSSFKKWFLNFRHFVCLQQTNTSTFPKKDITFHLSYCWHQTTSTTISVPLKIKKKKNTCRRQTVVLKIVYLPAVYPRENKFIVHDSGNSYNARIFFDAKHHIYINQKHYICCLFKKINIIHIPSNKFILPRSTVCLPTVDPVQMEYLR